MITSPDVWLKTDQAIQILGISQKTFSNYKNYVKACGFKGLPKNGIYQSQLWIMRFIQEEIQKDGVMKAKVKLKELIKRNQEVTQ